MTNFVLKTAKSLGPGLIMAGAAVGVSHLVQSTRAGANFGLLLLPLILLVNLLKYPFFEFGHRFYLATNKNLLQGYRNLGLSFLVIFLLLTAITSQISIAAVSFVTIGLAQITIHSGIDTVWGSATLIACCITIVILGRYTWLDKVIKIFMALLVVATVGAVLTAVSSISDLSIFQVSPETLSILLSSASLPFLIALMGWMPAPIELSTFQSLWIEARKEQGAFYESPKEGFLDFNFSYALTTLLAVLFLSLGALVMYQSGESFSQSASGFASQLVGLYTTHLGAWAGFITAVAALAAMFSTTLAVVDGYPRALSTGVIILFGVPQNLRRPIHIAWMLFGGLLATLMIGAYQDRLKDMVDLVTGIAFLSAPVFAYLNLRLILSSQLNDELRPPSWLKWLAYLGLVFLCAFALLYIHLWF